MVDLWSSRGLLFSGKVELIKKVLLPIIVHRDGVPTIVVTGMVDTMGDLWFFFWGGKTERIARERIYIQQGS